MYSQNMNFNDVSNSATMDGMAKTRKRDWSSAVLMWLLPMAICVNGKKVYESAIGRAVENNEWREQVRKAYSSSEVPCEIGKGSGKRGSCQACRELKKGAKVKRTVWQCLQCGPICKKCHDDGSHSKYRNMVKRGYLRPFHSYPAGRRLAKVIRRDLRASENLVMITEVP
jgi:hypothetical protein